MSIMNKTFFLGILLLLLVSAAEASSIYDSLSSQIRLNSSYKTEIIQKDFPSQTEEVIAEIYLFPKEYSNQEVIKIKTLPQGSIEKERIAFDWKFPKTSPSIEIISEIKISSETPKVYSRQKYPIDILMYLPQDVRNNLLATKHVDSLNPELSALAKKIIENEDDLWIVVSKIASWTKENVQYDLSTLADPVSQTASTVLQTKKGVCREITTLFIAMLRSLEIPARFVNGIVYTESQLQKWAPHQWAEVYFPEAGWVPFDVTFGQFGWVDNSHIKLSDSSDTKVEEYKFLIRGKNVDLKVIPQPISGEILSNLGEYSEDIEFDAKIFQERAGFGSYNLVEVELRNIANHYQTFEVKISKVNEVEFIDGNERILILKPGESKKAFFSIRIKEDLLSEKAYEIPIQVRTGRNSIALQKIFSTAKDIVYGQPDVTKALAFALEEQEKDYSSKVKFSCTPDVKEFYEDQYVNVRCTFNNDGYEELKNLQICLQKNCRRFDVKQNNFVETKFTIDVKKYGKQDLIAIAKNEQVSTNTQFTVEKLDVPVLKIKNLKYPKSFKENESVVFDLYKGSYSNPSQVNVSLKFNNKELNYFFDKIIMTQKVEFKLKNDDLKSGSNSFRLRITYRDSKNREHVERESFEITKGEGWFTKTFQFLKDFWDSIKSAFV